MRPRIVVVGSANTDLSIQVSQLPRAGETVLGSELVVAPGGKGANQAVAASRAGGRVSLIARLGQDHFGDQLLVHLRREQIGVRHVTRDRLVASGAALIMVSDEAENCIGVSSGANRRLLPLHVRSARSLFTGARAVLVQLETPLETVRTAANLAIPAGVPLILNPAPARKLPRALLRAVSILTPNESEAEALTGIQLRTLGAAKQAARKLRTQGVRTVVLTLGARGALLADEQGERLIPGLRVRAIDTTGAGDVFNGALAVAISEGQSIDLAVRFANTAAALAVTRRGAQSAAPTRALIERLLRTSARNAST